MKIPFDKMVDMPIMKESKVSRHFEPANSIRFFLMLFLHNVHRSPIGLRRVATPSARSYTRVDKTNGVSLFPERIP